MTHTKTGTETMVTDRGTQSAPVAPEVNRGMNVTQVSLTIS
jgi:hypothetical protein